jgi:hypothetical protein
MVEQDKAGPLGDMVAPLRCKEEERQYRVGPFFFLVGWLLWRTTREEKVGRKERRTKKKGGTVALLSARKKRENCHRWKVLLDLSGKFGVDPPMKRAGFVNLAKKKPKHRSRQKSKQSKPTTTT